MTNRQQPDQREPHNILDSLEAVQIAAVRPAPTSPIVCAVCETPTRCGMTSPLGAVCPNCYDYAEGADERRSR